MRWTRPSGAALRLGDVRLAGTAPNGQQFMANPQRVWMVDGARASLRGMDLGVPGPLPRQAHLGEFTIPQRGVFRIGRAFFESFDPSRHAGALLQEEARVA